MPPKLFNDRLDSKHQQLITKVKSELKAVCSGTIVEYGIDERHDGGFQADIVFLAAQALVQVIDDSLQNNRVNCL